LIFAVSGRAIKKNKIKRLDVGQREVEDERVVHHGSLFSCELGSGGRREKKEKRKDN